MPEARVHRRLTLAALVALCLPMAAQTRTLRIVAPFPPGGSTDILARNLAQRLGQALQQTALVENKPGANGSLGTESVGRSAPDGQTLLVTTNAGITINPLIYKAMADPVRALAPVAQLVELELVLAVRADLPAHSLREFIDLARRRPRGLSFASVGVGSLSHLAGEAFRLAAAVQMLHVPYKGAAPALADLLGGQVDCYFGTPPTFLPQLKMGKLRVLANTALTPSPWFESIPRVADLIADFEVTGWQGLFVPVATPRTTVLSLQRLVIAALADEAMRTRLAEQGMRVTGRTADELAAIIHKETLTWAKVVESSGITIQ